MSRLKCQKNSFMQLKYLQNCRSTISTFKGWCIFNSMFFLAWNHIIITIIRKSYWVLRVPLPLSRNIFMSIYRIYILFGSLASICGNIEVFELRIWGENCFFPLQKFAHIRLKTNNPWQRYKLTKTILFVFII